MKNGIKIIDMRCRPPYRGFLNEGYPFGLYDVAFAGLFRKMTNTTATPSLLYRDMGLFIREMDCAGIDIGVAPYRAAWGDPRNNRRKTDNQDLVDLMNEYPHRFLGIACLSPVYNTIDENISEIDKFCVNGPLPGIMLEPYIDQPNWFMNDKERVYPILEKCAQHDLPVLMTFGSLPGFPAEQIDPLLQACRDSPGVNFVCCHGAYPYVDRFCHAAFIIPNLYLSPDMYFINTHCRQMYLDAANYTLRDKLMFGTACPGIPLEFAVNYYMNSGLREEVLPDIMYRTAARLFHLPLD